MNSNVCEIVNNALSKHRHCNDVSRDYCTRNMDSKVVGEINPASLSYKWIISNFSSGFGCSVGCYVSSPKFVAKDISGDVQWCIEMYPQGYNAQAEGFLSIFLCADAKFMAQATFKILNNKSEAVESCTRTIKERLFYQHGPNSWGFHQFLNRDFIINPANNILNNDKLTIVCEISLPSHEDKKTNEQVPMNYDDLRLQEIDKYEVLINNDKFNDVSLISEGKSIKVLKGILAKSSLVFSAMFETEMKEKLENTVEITDIKYDILLEIIRFAYTGKVNDIDTIAGDLAVAADKYGLDGLKIMCENTICKHLNVENVVEYLDLAEKCHMDRLKREAIEFSIAHADEVIQEPKFRLLDSNTMYEVLCFATANKKQ